MVSISTNGALPAALESFVKMSDASSCEYLALIGIRQAPIHVAIPDVLQFGADTLFARETSHHGIRQVHQLDLAMQRIQRAHPWS
jgi:hypothetical protein